MADARTVRLEVPAKPDFVVLARLALSAVCRLTPLAPEDVADLKLAITEAATAFVDESARAEAGGQRADAEDRDMTDDTLSFAFALDERRLTVEIAGSGGMVAAPEERELGRAIIDATVDDWTDAHGTMRLVKNLVGGAG